MEDSFRAGILSDVRKTSDEGDAIQVIGIRRPKGGVLFCFASWGLVGTTNGLGVHSEQATRKFFWVEWILLQSSCLNLEFSLFGFLANNPMMQLVFQQGNDITANFEL
eukprot:c19284_g1_i1.p2 GENE.c19284_g1_i1~~c19284_g1_i1.p2  ORF type:complete len:108 (-),score=18.91 c19284_g1_i1:268-591(-)